MDKSLSNLLDYAQSNNRVCPKPIFWIQLWELLLARKKSDGGWQLSGPPIRAAWRHTTDWEKHKRFSDQICWASDHGMFEIVVQFVRSLKENQWHHLNE